MPCCTVAKDGITQSHEDHEEERDFAETQPVRQLRGEGRMSIRRLAQQLGRDYKSVRSETSLLIQTGLIARTAEDGVRIEWDGIVTELELAA